MTTSTQKKGFVLVVQIIPKDDKMEASTHFRGLPYKATGATNTEALNILFSLLKEHANLD